MTLNRTTLIEQLRKVAAESAPPLATPATVEVVGPDTISVRSRLTGAVIPGVPIVGGTGGVISGDDVYLIATAEGNIIALPLRSTFGGASVTALGSHTHDVLYHQKPEVTGFLNNKAALSHSHPPPDVIIANRGEIAGWTLADAEMTAFGTRLGRGGYLGMGPRAAVPGAYGNNVGAFIGYDIAGDQAQMSLYKDASNFLQWTGTQLLIKAANFELDAAGNIIATSATLSGTITATAGAIGGWVIGADYIRDAANSSGLASTVTGGDDVRFWAGGAFASRATAPFRVTEAGVVTATSGVIGGWTLGATTFTGGAAVLDAAGKITLGTGNNVAILDAADATYRLVIGHATYGSAPFRVSKAGVLTAISGTVGGWTLGAASLTGGAITLNAAGSITVGAGLVFDGATQTITVGASVPNILIDGANKYIRLSSYIAGATGYTINGDGSAEFENITLRGALRSSVFAVGTITATAGSTGLFKNAAKLLSDIIIPAAPTYGTTTVNLDMEDDPGLSHANNGLRFAANDVLRLKDPPSLDTTFKVASSSDQGSFWRYVCQISAGSASCVYRAGMAVINYGAVNTDASILMSVDGTLGSKPNISFMQNGALTTGAGGGLAQTLLGRLGNINGAYGYGADTYGLGFGQYGTAAQSWLTVDTTNGVRLGNNATVLGQWKQNGDLVLGEVAAAKGNVLISGGAISLRLNTTERIGLTSAGVMTLKDSTGAAKITLDGSGNMTLDGLMKVLGASGAIALGNPTPPTSAAVGTGIWFDRTGLYGLLTDVVQVKIDAATGALVAGGGVVTLDVDGLRMTNGGGYLDPSSIIWGPSAASIRNRIQGTYGGGGANLKIEANVNNAEASSSIQLITKKSGGGGSTLGLLSNASEGNFLFMVNAAGFIFGSSVGPPSAMLDVRGDGLFNGGVTADTLVSTTGQNRFDAFSTSLFGQPFMQIRLQRSTTEVAGIGWDGGVAVGPGIYAKPSDDTLYIGTWNGGVSTPWSDVVGFATSLVESYVAMRVDGVLTVGRTDQTSGANLGIVNRDTATNTKPAALTLQHRSSSGAIVAPFGTLFLMQADSSTNALRDQFKIESEWVTSTDASRGSRASLWVSAAGSGFVEGIRLEVANAGAVKLGFFGTAAVVRGTAFTQTYSASNHTHNANTSANFPAGGAGTAAGGWDTAGNRDLAITRFNALRVDVDAVRNTLNALIDDLQLLGLVP